MKYHTMDENSVIRYPKFRRLDSRHNANDGIINICDLPQAIIEYVLSFLPMKDAIRTSVLSRKWQYLWTSIPELIFDESSYSNRELFMNSVERVLLLHNRSSIKTFSLRCNVLRSASRINAWISAVARCNIEKCIVELTRFRENFVLPCALFTSNTLMELSVDIPTAIPPYIHLPSLKILYLGEVKFSNDGSIQRLFSSPTLEDLCIECCDWTNLTAICISAPKLKSLSIIEKDLDTTNGCGQVRIGECNLQYFDYEGSLLNEYSISDASIFEADILAPCWTKIQPEFVHRLYKMMHGMWTAQDLKLYGSTIQLLEAGAEFNIQGSFPIFKFLNSLELAFFDVKSGVLGKLLQSTPRLQTLRLSEVEGWSSYGEDGDMFDLVPPCFFSSLKKIIIEEVYLEAGLLYLLKSFLKSARVLQEFIIFPKTSIVKDDKKWLDFYNELVESPRGSKKCQIIFQ